MSRVSEHISEQCVRTLAKWVNQSKVTEEEIFGFRSTLKYSILNDPYLSITITKENEFEVFETNGGLIVDGGPILSEARLSDFLLGAERVQNQYAAVLKLKEAGGAPAWVLISAYYCAFFSAIEISKLFNRISFNLDADDWASLRNRSSGPYFKEFFANQKYNFVGVARSGKLVFSSSGDKPHMAAWQNACQALRPLFGNKDWCEADTYLEILTSTLCNPSKIRNNWNYKRVDYFGSNGERIAEDFLKLVGNPLGAGGWLRRQNGAPTWDDPCVVAILCESLSTSVIDAFNRVPYLIQS